MNKKLLASVGIVIALTGCKKDLGSALTAGAKLDAVCVTGYDYKVLPKQPGDTCEGLQVWPLFTNPNTEDATGSLAVVVGVDSSGVTCGGNTQSFSAQNTPGFQTPNTTVYPAKTAVPITDAVVGTAYDGGATYTIQIDASIPGSSETTTTTCHHFKAQNQHLAPK